MGLSWGRDRVGGPEKESGGGPAPGAHDGGARPAPPRARPLPGRGGGDGEVLKAIRPRGGPASEWDGARSATAPGSFRPRRPPACVSAGRAGAAAGAPSAGSPPPWVSRGGNREGGGGAVVAAATFPRRTLGLSGGAPGGSAGPWRGGGRRPAPRRRWLGEDRGARVTGGGGDGVPGRPLQSGGRAAHLYPVPWDPPRPPPTTPPPGDSCECGGEDGSQRDRRRSRWAGVGRRVGGYVPRLGWREWPLGVHVWAL